MVRVSQLFSLALWATTAWASIPSLPNYRVTWADDFNGPQGAGVDWNNNWYVQISAVYLYFRLSRELLCFRNSGFAPE